MSDHSAIEWTNASWNPVTGCTKLSAGCDFCYAERFAERFRGVPGHPFEPGFDLTLRPERLDQPARWRRPRLIFVNSMSDLFHKNIGAGFIGSVFDTMESADWHTYQVLTKRSSLMRNLREQALPEGESVHQATFGWACRSRTRAPSAACATCKQTLAPPCASCRLSRCLGRLAKWTSPAFTG